MEASVFAAGATGNDVETAVLVTASRSAAALLFASPAHYNMTDTVLIALSLASGPAVSEETTG